MKPKLLIAGCGYLGSAVGQKLSDAGWKAWGVRRDPAAADSLNRAGIEPLIGDLTDKKFLSSLPAVEYVLFCAAPSRSSDSYEKTYLESVQSLADRYWRDTIKKFVFISSTSVYSITDGSWVDELKDPQAVAHRRGLAPTATKAQTLLEAEKAVLDSGHRSIIFRLSGFYGPRRNRIRPILDGKFKPALTDQFSNRIYIDDAVNAIWLLLERGKAGEIYLGADDQPSTSREFYTWLYGKLGKELPEDGSDVMHGSGASNKRVWNGKIKKLGLRLEYPSYKKGYTKLIRVVGSEAS